MAAVGQCVSQVFPEQPRLFFGPLVKLQRNSIKPRCMVECQRKGGLVGSL